MSPHPLRLPELCPGLGGTRKSVRASQGTHAEPPAMSTDSRVWLLDPVGAEELGATDRSWRAEARGAG